MRSELLFTPGRGMSRQPAQDSALFQRIVPSVSRKRVLAGLHYALALVLMLVSLTSVAFENPLVVPAVHSDKAITSPLTAVAKAGERLVAVGQRGHILFSDDAGRSWEQAHVPISNDLVAVSFASPSHGWAVGHGGVVLNTEDGGLNWALQLEGGQTSTLISEYYQARIGDEAYPDAELMLEREEVLVSFGGTQPLMDVYFEDERNGYVVGIFNRLLRTRDGGNSWEPWGHRIDNPYELHFYSINAGADGLYITGEQGMVWRLDEAEQLFSAVETPYSGTLFGSAVSDGLLVAFGMRGNAYLSVDQGQNWEHLNIDSVAGITDGVITDNGVIALVNLGGELIISANRGDSFVSHPVPRSMPFYGLALLSGTQVTLVGAGGAQQLAVTTAAGANIESRVSMSSADSVVLNIVELGHGK